MMREAGGGVRARAPHVLPPLPSCPTPLVVWVWTSAGVGPVGCRGRRALPSVRASAPSASLALPATPTSPARDVRGSAAA